MVTSQIRGLTTAEVEGQKLLGGQSRPGECAPAVLFMKIKIDLYSLSNSLTKSTQIFHLMPKTSEMHINFITLRIFLCGQNIVNSSYFISFFLFSTYDPFLSLLFASSEDMKRYVFNTISFKESPEHERGFQTKFSKFEKCHSIV